ncbi:hypothetical protein T11_5111 [Trichinella zimbabwensis]|uniref:Uncharacterized protein n=1 Tax=Trichinella zimbabwensis TaxID=268475 RepID=A0A0V1H424_9BILA|nr:hypothetical protein T11_5111 [Trichinella zimbabwensis]
MDNAQPCKFLIKILHRCYLVRVHALKYSNIGLLLDLDHAVTLIRNRSFINSYAIKSIAIFLHTEIKC